MDRLRFTTGREVPPADYLLEVVGRADAETALRALIVQTLTRPGFHLKSLRSVDTGIPNEVQVHAELSADRRDDTVLDSAVGALSAEPTARAVRWTIRGEAGVDWGGRSND
jgi:putative Mg2+ transporter-C (MgtC) family protein